MFLRAEIEQAVDLQKRSYRLLKWTAKGIDRGLLSSRAAHEFATLPDAAYAWIDEHYESLPSDARPGRDDLAAFSNMYATYLHASFDLAERPGRVLYSPEAHCFCPLCSWLVDAPRLRPKRVKTANKNRAKQLMRDWGRELAAQGGVPVRDAALEAEDLQVPLALGAYGKELLNRMRGFSEGAATLALWRKFAWEPTGSPKKGFKLTADLILDAEQRVLELLSRASCS